MTETPLEIRESREEDSAILHLVGEIDMASAPELKSAIESETDTVKRVVVDLSDVTFLDSSALNTLVHCQRELARNEVGFRVVVPADHAVRRVFEITHLTEPLNVVDSLDAALVAR